MQGADDFTDELRSQLSLLGEQERIPAYDVHRRVFLMAEQEWRDYICYLDAELATLVLCHRIRIHSFLRFSDSGLGGKGVLCRR